MTSAESTRGAIIQTTDLSMDVVSNMALIGAAFAGSHLAMTTPPLRTALVDRLGSVRFIVLTSLVTWIGLGFTLAYYAAHHAEGPPGLGLGSMPAVYTTAMIASAIGLVLMIAIISPSGGYLRSAPVVFSRVTGQASGLERITRHPFFMGLALLGLGHAAVASRRIGLVLFGTLAAMALLGALLQDRKLARARPDTHPQYLRATSWVPFWAIVRGRQSLQPREQPWVALAVGLGAAWYIRQLHPEGVAHAWLVIFGISIAVPVWFALASAARHHRARSQGPRESPHRRA